MWRTTGSASIRLGVAVAAVALASSLAGIGPLGASPGTSGDVWSSPPYPDDFRSQPTDDLPADLDALARSIADVDNPGPIVGMFGCGEVDILASSPTIAFELFDGEALPTRWTEGRSCRAGGAETLFLELDGETLSQDQQQVVGRATARFVRGDEQSPFVRVEITLTDGRCFSIAPSDGFLGGSQPAAEYLLQGWNFDADPAVDCWSRQVPPSTTTTTDPSSTTTSSLPATTEPPGTTTTTTVPGSGVLPGAAPTPASAAQPVAGTASYTG